MSLPVTSAVGRLTLSTPDALVASIPHMLGFPPAGSVVIDAAYHPGNVGDVQFEAAVERVARITPEPGGVEPTTIAALLEQTVSAAVARRTRALAP